LMSLALAGFFALLIIHIAGLAGHARIFNRTIEFLVPGMFVVWFCTIFVATRLTRDFKQKDFWKAALRGCPTWMRYGVWVVFGYSWLGFLLIAVLSHGKLDSNQGPSPVMSAVLMTFYGVAFAINYSALHVEELDSARRCMNGHELRPLAKFCDECGAPATQKVIRC
jgi:hypothetical protein